MKATLQARTENQFVTAMTLFFSAAIGIGLWRHEMWRDEYHAWGLVLNSDSLSQMMVNLRGEGHLPFSYIVFYFISRITENAQAMQVVQFCLAIASAYLLLRFAPFNRWQKVLFLFGYFPLYEYGVISRSYTWDMLGLFGFCAVYGWAKEHQRKPWLAWVFLLIMASNEPFGILMALPLAALLIAELCAGKKIPMRTWLWLTGIVSCSSAALIYVLSHIVTSNQWKSLLHNLPHDGEEAIKSMLQTLKRMVIPKIRLPENIWDVSTFYNQLRSPNGIVEWTIAIILALIIIYLFCRLFIASLRLPLNFVGRAAIFAVWSSGTALLFFFIWSYDNSINDARHTGHVYLFFIACWWIANYFPKSSPAPNKFLSHVQRHAKSDFRFLLLAQFAFGFYAYALDFVYPFSSNQAVVAYLKAHHLQDALLVAPAAVTVAMGREAYFPQFDMVAKTFYMTDYRSPNSLHKPTEAQLMQRTWQYIEAHNRDNDVVVIQEPPESDTSLQKYFLWQSPPAIAKNEHFYIYLIARGALASEPK